MPGTNVLVVGDCIIDQHVYEDHSCGCCTRIVEQNGGALLIHRLMEQTATTYKSKSLTVSCGVSEGITDGLPKKISLWSLRPTKETLGKKTWDFSRSLGCCVAACQTLPEKLAATSQFARIVVINDAGLYFRHGYNRHLWPSAIREEKPKGLEHVVLTMSAPLVNGDLWRELSVKFREELVVITTLEDILKEETGITTGSSWERTLEELTFELLHNGAISDLLKCRHLIVRIGTAGALWVDNTKGSRKFTAVFEPTRQDSERVLERDETPLCFAAAIALQIHSDDKGQIPRSIRSGIKAILDLADLGYVQQTGKESPSFPHAEIIAALASSPTGFVDVDVSTDRTAGDSPWTIMGDDLSNNLGIARRVALFGPRALGIIPYSLFGKLTVVDRSEIESLCGIRQLMRGYVEQKKAERPLSIAVFGAPGSGKSFGIKQIAKEILGPDCAILEFNLSQFTGPQELVGALHQVRDKVLEGTVPLVFWDEFDSREYQWLQFLLAPMQDGKFQEGQITHPVGKCIFVFAGGTSYTMENFTPPTENKEAAARFKLVKGPDFVSRLNGYLNVLGPNPRQRFDHKRQEWVLDELHSDRCYPIRRALLIRAMLSLNPKQTLEIDSGVLTALLEIGSYKHGARSLETVIKLTRRGASMLVRSNLPPEEQLSLHVDYEKFMALVKRDLPFRMKAETVAPHVHDFYRKLCLRNGWGFIYDMDYENLPDEIKADNIAAAARIPSILNLAGLKLEEKGKGKPLSEAEYGRVIEPLMEKLAEVEHNGWMEQKYRSGWTLGNPRDDARKLHHAMEEYARLTEKDKEKDRESVRNFQEVVGEAGFVVVKADLPADGKRKQVKKI